MNDIELLLTVLLAVGGALFAAVLGWSDSKEPFNARKFLSSVMHGIVAALLFFTVTYTTGTQASFFVYLGAFTGGAGIDALWNRGSGAVGWGRQT